MSIPRDVAQMLIEKLDLGHCTAKEAKEYAARWHGVTLTSRTRERLAREIASNNVDCDAKRFGDYCPVCAP